MKNNNIHPIVLVTAAIALLGGSCKTSEENYRAAYERAVAARNDSEPIDSTVYGRMRKELDVRTIDSPAGPIEVRTQMVRPASDGGGLPEQFKRYNAVAGRFKQLFNAVSLRDRIADQGYPAAIVVETAEPYYYVVAASFADIDRAAQAVAKLKKQSPAWLKEPCPYILDATARRIPLKQSSPKR